MTDKLTEIVELTKKLVAIPSVTENPDGLAEVLTLALSYLPGYTVEHFERNGIKSALVYSAPERPKRFTILLNCHLDVIPGKEEQYTPRVDGDRIYGAGVMDMKANLACALLAFRDVAHMATHPIALQLVTDEEMGGFNGTKLQVEEGVRADFVLATEPTSLDIVYKTKGILWLKITAHGVTAHGAYPWRGENAIWKMHDFLSALQKAFPVPKEEVWSTTVNVSTVASANHAYNKIPDDCVVGLDIRYAPEDTESILGRIQALVPVGFTVEVLAQEPATLTDVENPLIMRLKEIAHATTGKDIVLRGAQGSSDARHFAPVLCPGIEFGPVGGGIGSDEEWVDIPSLESYYEIIKKFIS